MEPTDVTDSPAPIPEDNLPGHHPEHEQDKPDVRVVDEPRGVHAEEPERDEEPRRRARFRFHFDPVFQVAALPFGVLPQTSFVEVADGHLSVRFGFWRLRTRLDNVAGAEVTGPYAWPKVIGPPRLSLADRGVTFATTSRRGVCIRFRRPVGAVLPALRHPSVTVTVDDPGELAAALNTRQARKAAA